MPQPESATDRSSVWLTRLLPIMGAVFTGYLVVGVAMPVIPMHVHEGLGLSTFVVGLVAGSQFAASLLSRFVAGNQADTRGSKWALVTGLLASIVAGILYLVSLFFTSTPVASVAILLLGRGVLGVAESFIIAGALTWALALAGPENTGKVMAWVGTAMYMAFAVGAPLGASLHAGYGFLSIALATTLVPLATLLFVAPLPTIRPTPRARPPFRTVLSAVGVPGLGLALSSVGFGAITTFVVLLFSQRGWSYAWVSLTALSVAFVGGRVVFGHLPDRIGGAKVALVCVLIEAVGQGSIWIASSPALIFIGAALTGLGYSLVYPGFGVIAIRRVPRDSRGLASGAYTACLDLALGIAIPGLGFVASRAGLDTVFLVSTLVVLCASAVAMGLLVPGHPQIRGQ